MQCLCHRQPSSAVPDAFADKRPDAHLLNGPALEGHGVSQSDVYALFADPPEPPAPLARIPLHAHASSNRPEAALNG